MRTQQFIRLLGSLVLFWGSVTVAYADEKGFAAKSNVLKSDGKPLKFHNW